MKKEKIDKNFKKQKDREATIKHYILGYILECAVKNNINITIAVRRLLVYELKIIDVQTFVACLYKARINRALMVEGTKKNYRNFKKLITLLPYGKDEQINIIKKMQDFANNFENGLFIKPDMCESSFEDVKII